MGRASCISQVAHDQQIVGKMVACPDNYDDAAGFGNCSYYPGLVATPEHAPELACSYKGDTIHFGEATNAD